MRGPKRNPAQRRQAQLPERIGERLLDTMCGSSDEDLGVLHKELEEIGDPTDILLLLVKLLIAATPSVLDVQWAASRRREALRFQWKRLMTCSDMMFTKVFLELDIALDEAAESEASFNDSPMGDWFAPRTKGAAGPAAAWCHVCADQLAYLLFKKCKWSYKAGASVAANLVFAARRRKGLRAAKISSIVRRTWAAAAQRRASARSAAQRRG